MENLNYYILLGLSFNPPEEDEIIIRKTINDKRAYWSNLINHPTKKNEARMYLDKISDIEMVMLKDPSRRLKEAAKARDILFQKEVHQEKLFLLTKDILVSKGYITEGELKTLRKKFPLLDESFINDKIGHYLREISTKKEVIDEIIYKKIRKNLDIIGKETLYTFLKCKNTDTIYELQEAIDKIYEEIRMVSKKDSKVTAKGELHGLCKTIFKNKNSKIQYDESIKREKLSYLWDIIEICGSKRIIEYSEYRALVQVIKSEGFTEFEGREFIIDYSTKNKLTLILDENIKKEEATKNYKSNKKENNHYSFKKELNKKVDDTKEGKNKNQNDLFSPTYKNNFNNGNKNTEVDGYKYEVVNLSTKSGDGFIKLSWKPFNFKHKIEIWKKEGEIPMERGDGVLLCSTTKNEVYDYKVKNGKTYGYLIKVVYYKNNKIYETEGKTCFDTPNEMKFNRSRKLRNPNMISKIRKFLFYS